MSLNYIFNRLTPLRDSVKAQVRYLDTEGVRPEIEGRTAAQVVEML